MHIEYNLHLPYYTADSFKNTYTLIIDSETRKQLAYAEHEDVEMLHFWQRLAALAMKYRAPC